MRMMTFVLLLCLEQAIYASVISDTAEKEAICNRIRQVQSEMRSVIVKSELVREYGEGPERQSEEWGYSGEKLFLRRQWPSKIEEPASDRFQIGIWDGKHYKLYDTHTQSGSVRSSYDLQSSDGVPFLITSIYARFFGTFSEGSLTQLLDRMPPETWRFERDESDSTICVSLDMGGVVDRWWLDPGKNYMVKRHEITSVDRNTKEIRTRVVTEAVEAKEVRPGIWLPTRISELGTYRDRLTPTKTEVVVQEVKVNDPDNERVFDWQFPKEGTFYDYTIGKAVVPGETDDALQEDMAEMVDDMKAMSSKQENTTDPNEKDAASSAPGEKAEQDGKSDDGTPTERSPAGRSSSVVFLVLAGTLAAAVLVIHRRR